MKKITLSLIVNPEKNSIRTELNRYRIFLDWGLTNSFTNKKKAAIFQTRYNAWLNDTFYELNFIYSSVLFIYRKSWIFLNNDMESKLSRAFTIIDNQFNKLHKSEYRGSDGSFYAMQSIEALNNQLIYCINLLLKFRKSKRDWENVKELDLLLSQLNRIMLELKETADPGELGRQTKREN